MKSLIQKGDMMTDEKQKEMQKKMIEMKMIENGLNALRQKEGELLGVVEDLNRTKEAIEAMEKYDGDGTMIPLGSGNFVMGKIDEPDKVLVGIGAGIAVTKSRKEAIDHVQERITDIENSLKTISDQNNQMVNQMIKLREEVQG